MDWSKFPTDLNDTAARLAADGTNWCLTCDTTILPRADARLCRDCTRTRSNYRRTRNRRDLRKKPKAAPAVRKTHTVPLAFDVAAFTEEYRNFDAAIAGLADATEGLGEYDVQYAAEAVTSFYYNIVERLLTILAKHDIDLA